MEDLSAAVTEASRQLCHEQVEHRVPRAAGGDVKLARGDSARRKCELGEFGLGLQEIFGLSVSS